MSKVKIQGNASGTGVLTVTAPNTSTDRTITLPDESVTLGAATPSIDDNGDATAITIDSSERVGIGTGSPAGSLEIKGSNASEHLVLSHSSGSSYTSIGQDSSDNLRIYSGTNERMRILAGGGITFNGDTAAANALDDYEEGTFIPTFIGDTNPTVTYHEKQGYYTKIGNMVYIRIWMRTASVSNTGTSTLYIDNLPFTVASSNQSKGGIVKGHIQNWGTIPENLFFYGGTTSIYLWDETNGTTHKTNILASGADKNQISCEGFYEVA